MELKSTIDIILKDLQEVRMIINDLKKHPEVPVLQLELAMAKCRSAEDVIRLLGELSEKMETNVKEEVGRKDNEPEENRIEENLADEAVTGEGVDDTKTDDVKIIPMDSDNQILADKYSHLSKRINEQIRDNNANGSFDISKKIPIKDLSKAIGLNDKFYFIRELFNGDADAYKLLIDSLNKAGTLGEADTILKGSVKKLANSEPARQLLELVERKLSIGSNE